MADWYAFDKLEPIGEHRDDFRTSYLAAVITNLAISIHGKKGSKQKQIKDFLLEWDVGKPKGTQSPEEIKNLFMGIAQMNKKKEEEDKKKKRDKTRLPVGLQRRMKNKK